MSDDTIPRLVHLRDGELFHGPTDRPAWITVLRGRAWITQAGDLDDHFLAAGQSMHLPAGAGVLVGADGAAQLVLAKAPRRWDRWRRLTMDWWFRPSIPTHDLADRPAR
jgi:hypothetical protein